MEVSEMSGNNKKYTVEFKQAAVKLVTEEGYSQAEAARRLGVGSKNLNRWVRELKKGDTVKTSVTAEQAELVRLRKENKRLQMERDILKKAAAFFASESL
jgi:transposase